MSYEYERTCQIVIWVHDKLIVIINCVKLELQIVT